MQSRKKVALTVVNVWRGVIELDIGQFLMSERMAWIFHNLFHAVSIKHNQLTTAGHHIKWANQKSLVADACCTRMPREQTTHAERSRKCRQKLQSQRWIDGWCGASGSLVSFFPFQCGKLYVRDMQLLTVLTRKLNRSEPRSPKRVCMLGSTIVIKCQG